MHTTPMHAPQSSETTTRDLNRTDSLKEGECDFLCLRIASIQGQERHSTTHPVLIASIPEDTPRPHTAVGDQEEEEEEESHPEPLKRG